MVKRFTTDEKYKDPWFRKLPPRLKCFFDWMYCHCDVAGTMNGTFDFESISFHVGEEITIKDLDAFENRLIKLKCGRYWLTGFIDFQYPDFENKNSNMIKVVKRIIKNFAIPYPLIGVLDGSRMDHGCVVDSVKSKNKSMSQVTGQCQSQGSSEGGPGGGSVEQDQEAEFVDESGEPDYPAIRDGGPHWAAFKAAYPLNGSTQDPIAADAFQSLADVHGGPLIIEGAKAYDLHCRATQPTYPHSPYISRAPNWLKGHKWTVDWAAQTAAWQEEKRRKEGQGQKRAPMREKIEKFRAGK